MAIQIVFQWQNTDSTSALNQRLASLIEKGVYYGGDIVPVGAGSLNAIRQPFFAVGRDGITIVDTDTYAVTYQASLVQYHCILAKYNPLGTPSSPTIEELILTASEYNAHPEKSYLIVLAVVTPSASEVTYSHIDYSNRDDVGPFGHKWFKGIVENETDLPTGTPNFNKVGDTYVVQNDPPIYGFGVYTWTGTLWRLVAANGASTLDGAYDDNGASPGQGREILVDAEAVLLTQSTTSQRSEDKGNAALRIDKTGSTTFGDGALDIKMAQDTDVASMLVRSVYTNGTNMECHEPVDLTAPNVIATSRAGANWALSPQIYITLVEVSGSSLGSDGLYLVGSLPTTASASLLRLDGAAITLASESGLTANFFTVRFSTGANRDNAQLQRLWSAPTTGMGSIECYGSAGGTNDIGKVWVCHEDHLGSVFEVFTTLTGITTPQYVCRLGKYGNFESYIPDGIAVDGFKGQTEHTSAAGVSGVHRGTGDGVRASTVTGIAVNANVTGAGVAAGYFNGGLALGIYAESATTVGIQGISGSSFSVYGLKQAGTDPAVLGKSEVIDGVGVRGTHDGLTAGGRGVGVKGLSNDTDTTYAAVWGSAFGNSIGVKGDSVFGNGVEGIAQITSLFGFGVKGSATWLGGVRGESVNGPGVSGEGGSAGCYGKNTAANPGVLGENTSTGPGVRGTSTGGVGVEGDGFGFTATKTVFGKWTLSAFQPEGGDAAWLFKEYPAGNTPEQWESQASSSGYLLLSTGDFQEGFKLTNVYIPVYVGTGDTITVTIKRVRWTINTSTGEPSWQPVEATMGTQSAGPGGGDGTISVSCAANNTLSHGNGPGANAYSDYIEILINHSGTGTSFVRGAFFQGGVRSITRYLGEAVP
jgi:hypothetical protein